MCKKCFFLASFLAVLSLAWSNQANAANLNLMGWWKLDGDTLDFSGNERHGTVTGNPQFTVGVFNEALQFDGDDYVSIDGYKGVLGPQAFTIAAWVNWTSGTGTVVAWGQLVDGARVRFLVRNNGQLRMSTFSGRVESTVNLSAGQWYHVIVTKIQDQDLAALYLDGQDVTSTAQSFTSLNIVADVDVGIGWDPVNQGSNFVGIVDEVLIYDKTLTQEEIQGVISGEILPPSAQATSPYPADEATDVPRDVTLSWGPGESVPAVGGHRIYLSENFSDVNDGIGGIIQDANSYTPSQRLDFARTYYWRVDEAGGASGWEQGDVWQFTAEPLAYPIAGDSITATASSSNNAAEGPENTINGSGLDTDDLHSVDSTAMWLSSAADPNAAWIQYEFDRIHKLYQMVVWNHNTSTEALVGLGIKEATIEYSTDGAGWTPLGATHEFAQGTGTLSYAANTTIDFEGAAAKYVKITAHSNWAGFVPQFGLSEVRFLSTPVVAREPSPEPGTMGVDVNGTLRWRAGREAAAHDVYLSTDQQAVMDGNTPVTTVTTASYSSPALNLGSTYFWRIDEVNEAETPTTWQGDLWNFTTQEYFVVDDFESYNDIPTGEEESHLVYEIWSDGLADPSNGGSQIGYFAGTSLETNIVHDGQQSVPLFYDNTVATFSEVTVNVADLQVGQDWSKHGIKALTLRFYGDPNNSVTEQMYVEVNGSKITYDGDAENLARIGWQMWYIDLASIGVDLSNITELTIGFERAGAVGGQGVVLLDGIRLYAYDRQIITPVEPAPTGLQAHYEFEGTFNDSSGNGRHGTAMGSPTFVPGKIGQAIDLRGLNDYVEITGYKGILGSGARAVTAWVRTTSTTTGEIVGWGPNVAGQRMELRINDGRLRCEHQGGNVQGSTNLTDGGWHHVAVAVGENATISYPAVILYLDGLDDTIPATDPDAFATVADNDVRIGSRPSNNDRFFMGQIDDVRIYDRVLSPDETAWLAGRIEPFDKLF